MKKQIDELVEQILAQLSRDEPIDPYVAVCFRVLRCDGVTAAIELRAILANWAMDVGLHHKDRAYAAQQLDCLPDF